MDGDFPDLEAGAAAGNSNAPLSKADGAMQWSGMGTANGPRSEQPQGFGAAGEERKQATKPVFRGKAKLNLAGASNEEV